MPSTPDISVLLPVYNSQNTILEAIQSILNQTYHNFELIIVENGSTDKTLKIISQIEDERIVLLSLPEKDIVKALNTGTDIAKGKYIARMDADDISYPKRLELQRAFLEEHKNFGLVSGLIDFVGDRNTSQGYYQHVVWLNNIVNHKEIYYNRFVDAPVSHPSVMFRNSLVKKYGGYRKGSFPEDFELWNRWLLHGVKMTKIKEPLIKWIDSSKRLSRTDSRYDDNKFSSLKASYFAEWFQQKFPKQKPNVLIWGNGSSVKKRAKHLLENEISIAGFIDIVKSNSLKSIYHEEAVKMKDAFILNYVSDRKGRVKIYNFLIKHGFKEGKNFYMMY